MFLKMKKCNPKCCESIRLKLFSIWEKKIFDESSLKTNKFNLSFFRTNEINDLSLFIKLVSKSIYFFIFFFYSSKIRMK